MRKLVRLGLAAAVVAMLGSIVTPAEATSVRAAVFVANVNLTSPLGLPAPGTVPNPTVTQDLPLTGALSTVPNLHVEAGGTTSGLTVTTTACADVGANVLKAGAPAHAGLCSFTSVANALNHVRGWCGFVGGQVVVSATDALGVVWTIDLHFNALGPVLVLTGHARNNATGQTGLVAGVAAVVLVPAVTGTTTSNDCTNNTASNFLVPGVVVWAAT